MKSLFRATAILSGSSAINILVGLISAKTLALVLQPSGYGFYGLLQSFVSLSTMIAGMGIGVGLVREGAAAVAGKDQAGISTLRRASWILVWGFGTLALLLMFVFRTSLSQWALGDSSHQSTILLMGIAVLFTLAANIQSSTLNAYHRVEALATSSIAVTIVTAAATITSILVWGATGVIAGIIVGAVASCLTMAYFVRREIGPPMPGPTYRDIVGQAKALVRFGGPYTTSLVVGAGVQLALPILIMHLLDTESAGYYKAAAAISVSYLGLLTTAMGQDYYPRLSASKDKPNVLVQLINEQHRLVMIVGVPIILGTLALVPYLLPLVYSTKFTPAVEVLEWQLIGDIFKFSSWTMSYAILTRCSSRVYLATELFGGAVGLTSLWFCVRWFGLPGLGISFLLSYVVYYAMVWVVVRRDVDLVWTTWNKRMMLAAIGAAIIIRTLPFTPFSGLRTPVALALATVASLYGLATIYKEFGLRNPFNARARLFKASQKSAVLSTPELAEVSAPPSEASR